MFLFELEKLRSQGPQQIFDGLLLLPALLVKLLGLLGPWRWANETVAKYQQIQASQENWEFHGISPCEKQAESLKQQTSLVSSMIWRGVKSLGTDYPRDPADQTPQEDRVEGPNVCTRNNRNNKQIQTRHLEDHGLKTWQTYSCSASWNEQLGYDYT